MDVRWVYREFGQLGGSNMMVVLFSRLSSKRDDVHAAVAFDVLSMAFVIGSPSNALQRLIDISTKSHAYHNKRPEVIC